MKYCAFLRGINVGGIKLKMTDLKQEFEAAGFTDVATVLATGMLSLVVKQHQIYLSYLYKPL